MDDVAFLIGFSLMLIGLVGVVVPMMPGVPIMLLGAFLHALLTGFEVISWWWLILFVLITVSSIVVDFLATATLTRRLGGSRWATAGSVLGTITGLLFFGAYGALLGGISGAVVAELSIGRSIRRALRSGTGAFVGFVVALISDAMHACLILALYLWLVL